MKNDEFWLYLEGLLAQADELSSAGDPSAACTRARFALGELSLSAKAPAHDDARREEFRARAEHELRHYDRLLLRRHKEVAARAATFLDHERRAFANPMPPERKPGW